MITKWFTIEYALWFSFFLPGLASMHAPIPLGGTSNHFRRVVLQALGAWDPFNVTEDADLGIRMFREGYSVRVLESSTFEEANSDFVNWMKQRSRWFKGYLQTFAVHLREPQRPTTELGWKGFMHFTMFVGGTPILAMINPIFWLMTHALVRRPSGLHPGAVPGADLLSRSPVVGVRELPPRLRDGHELPRGESGELLVPALLVPLYWVMMSMAAVKALSQLVGAPNFWEKTVHGLHHEQAPTPIEIVP